VVVAQVVVQLHVARGGETGEPGVGHGFNGLGEPFALHAGDELLALSVHLSGPGLAGDHGHVALGLAGRALSWP